MSKKLGFAAIAALSAAIIASIAAWITHIWWSISMLIGPADIPIKLAVIMIVGIIVPPLGMLHGVWLWFS